MNLTFPQLRSLPKVDLHRHLDCSMRWSTVVEIARDLKLELDPIPGRSRGSYLVTDQMKDLGAVLRKFLKAQKVLASEEILTRLAFEACEDAFNDNVLMVEFRFAPTFITDGHSNLDATKIHRAFEKGLQMAEKKWGLIMGLIGIVQRIKTLKEAEASINFFIENKSEYVGVDLADNEEGFEPKTFAPVFEKAKKAGLHVTIHSGETPHRDAGQWMLDSIKILGAERIGHGVQCIHHPEVMRHLKDNQIPLEVCPLSNWLTQAFPRFEDHPLRKLMEAGVPLTLNSDDPGIFASTLTDDYEIAQRYHGFTTDHFRKANQLAFQKSFIPEFKKNSLKKVFHP